VEVKKSAIRPNNAQRAGATKSRNKSKEPTTDPFVLNVAQKIFLREFKQNNQNKTTIRNKN
jgi:hypothetical protein